MRASKFLEGAIAHHENALAELLTNKCPSCLAAYDEFDGCCSLTCARCGIAFCGFCNQVSGKEIHSHVTTCEENPKKGSYHRDPALYPKQQLDRKKRLVEAYLLQLDPAIQDAVRKGKLLSDFK